MNDAKDHSTHDHAELELETRRLLLALGARPRLRELSDDEQRRAEAAAQSALAEMLEGAPARSPGEEHRVARGRTGRGDPSTRSRGPRRWRSRGTRGWALTAVSVATAAALCLVVVQALPRTGAPPGSDVAAQGPAASTNIAPPLGDVPVPTTPDMPRFEDAARDPVGSGLTLPPASETLKALADAALEQPDPPAAGGGVAAPRRIVTESWRLSDAEAGGGPTRSERAVDRAPLPDDEALLVRALLRADTDCADPASASCIARAIAILHSERVAPPRATATLWRALARSEGVEVLGTTKDRLGRTATAIQAPGLDDRHALLLYADPATGACLGSDEILVADDPELGLTAPAVVAFTAIVSVE